MTLNYAKLYSTFQEFLTPIEATVRGEIPLWVKGSLLKNGPGIFEVGLDKYNHWFDGLAIMERFQIENGKVYYTSKYLISETYQKNMASQRIVVSEFGTLAYPDPCKSLFHRYFSYFFPGKPTDNDLVNFVQCGDEIYACSDIALFNRIDPNTLDTIEQVNLHKYVATNTATAHPHYDRLRNVYNMGSSSNSYNIIFTPNPKGETSDKALEKSKIVASIPARNSYMSYYHSFGMTENYFIFAEMPFLVNSWKVMTSTIFRRPVSDCFDWYKDEKSVFHLIKKSDSNISPTKYVADGFFIFHHVNAYEVDDCVIVDSVAYPDGSIMKHLTVENLRQGILPEAHYNYGKLWRFILPLQIPPNAKVGENLLASKSFETNATAILQDDGSIYCSHQILCDKFLEFPRINYEKCNGLPYRFCYATGIYGDNNFLLHELYKIDVESGTIKIWRREHEAQFVGEPVFIPRPGSTDEDDGVVLSPVTDIENEERNFLLILNAKTFEEIARAEINHLIAYGFHSHFVSTVSK